MQHIAPADPAAELAAGGPGHSQGTAVEPVAEWVLWTDHAQYNQTLSWSSADTQHKGHSMLRKQTAQAVNMPTKLSGLCQSTCTCIN